MLNETGDPVVAIYAEQTLRAGHVAYQYMDPRKFTYDDLAEKDDVFLLDRETARLYFQHAQDGAAGTFARRAGAAALAYFGEEIDMEVLPELVELTCNPASGQ